jgi:hypothetical protein
MAKRFYGWKRALSMTRFKKFQAPAAVLASLPASADLSAGVVMVDDQGQLGSCGPNAMDMLLAFDQQAEMMKPPFGSSRLFTYYNTRQLMGTTGEDSGVDNATMLAALEQFGYCPESDWPYDISRFTERPPDSAYAAAAGNLITDDAAIPQNLDQMRGCIAAGRPFVFGFTVYESFESDAVAATGDVPMPRRREMVVGGHDILFVSYDDSQQRFGFVNPWGTSWGRKGFGTFPYAYATDSNLAGDFVTVKTVPSGLPGPGPGPGPAPTPLAGQVIVDLDGKTVTLPVGWTTLVASLKPSLDPIKMPDKKKRAMLGEVFAAVCNGADQAALRRIAQRYGIDINAILALVAAVLQLLQSLGVL